MVRGFDNLLIVILACRLGEIHTAILSRNKAIQASSVFSNWVPTRMVDGNLRTDADACECCSATTYCLNPWYELDLGSTHKIQQIDVVGRTELIYESQNFQNMQIMFRQLSVEGLTDSPDAVMIEQVRNITYVLPVPKYTRYISLVLRGEDRVFTICELIVYGDCQDGQYGDFCENRCHSCDGDSCDKVTGICPSEKCLPGYAGQKCDTECQAGRYGPGCTLNCGYCLDKTECDKTNGKCPGRCLAGYQGANCQQECNQGYYGKNCQIGCGNCRQGTVCIQTNGTCPLGCLPGYQGDLCLTDCDDGTYGDACKLKCGFCVNGIPCNKVTGVCEQGCSSGYKGSYCYHEESSSKKESCSVPLAIAIGGTAGTILLIEAVVGAVVYLIRKRRRAHADKRSPGEDNPYANPNCEGFTSEHPYELAERDHDTK